MKGSRRQQDITLAWTTLALALACCVAAVALVDVRFTARKLQSDLNEAERFKTELHEQNRRYLIELTAFTDYSVMRRSAIEGHEMVFPAYEKGTYVNLRKAVQQNIADTQVQLASK